MFWIDRCFIEIAHSDDPRAWHDPEIINPPKDLSPPGLESLELKPRPPMPYQSMIYRVIKSTKGMCTHPEILEVEVGDIVLRKFDPMGMFARWVYEEDEYVMRNKFPHISDATYDKMKNKTFLYVRKFGSHVKTGVHNVAFPDVGSDPVLLKDSQAGMVPLAHLQNIQESEFPGPDGKIPLYERDALRPRFQLP